jgi:hypothetical protein
MGTTEPQNTKEVKTYRCRKCKTYKSFDEFHKDNSRETGLCNICKDCHRLFKGYTKRLEVMDGFKFCHICKLVKQETEFNLKKNRYDGLQSHCKDCQSLKNRSYRINYKDTLASYRTGRKHISNAIKRHRFKSDPLFNIKISMQARMSYYWRHKGFSKDNSTEIVIGAKYEIVVNHIEKQFSEGMAWNNRGKWHIDHKIPLSSAKNEDELKALFHYTNLQPLWAVDNLKKGSKII